MEKLFDADILSKRERVERALNHQPLDRVPTHDQISYNPKLVEHFTGRKMSGFDYDVRDLGMIARKTLDCTFPIVNPKGKEQYTSEDGFVYQFDEWMSWYVARPFEDEEGAADWIRGRIAHLQKELDAFDPKAERENYRKYMLGVQELIGETVYMDLSSTGFCDLYDKMGLMIFSFFMYEYEELVAEYMTLSGTLAAKKAAAAGDYELSPIVLIAEDFCSKSGTIFSPDFLRKYHYPWVKALTEAWHKNGLKVIYHTDGNFKDAIPDLMDCGVDGFYCLERSCGMHIEELANQYPNLVWMGGVDGVYTMELGSPEATDAEVKNIIEKTHALERGGVFIDSSTEINPSTPVDSFLAMINATDRYRNKEFCFE